ncbi:MAG: hypothetical protein DME34_03560 [Verrucomicrobia bacterium]|nr:MAG: hypothetical protein DME34_03560 [Verrucomicrobiota bacterium]
MKREIILATRIVQAIRWLRGEKVLPDSDLAALYGVVMFRLTVEELRALRCQFGISKPGRGGLRYRPYALH